MNPIELEIAFDDLEKAIAVTNRLQNGTSYIGTKHGQTILFIKCPVNEILHLGQELHYELQALSDDE